MNKQQYTIRNYIKGDELKIIDLFKEVFEEDQSQTWEWKFKHTDDNLYSVLALRGEDLVGQYTGLRRNMLIKGRPAGAIQICDVMVHNSARGQRKNSGVFLSMAKKFIDLYLNGNSSIKHSFGFPSMRHFKLGKKLGIYEAVSPLWKYTNIPLQAHEGKKHTITEIRDRNKIKSLVGKLWHEMASDYKNGVIGVRDSNYIEWRYLQHPTNQYRFLLLQSPVIKKPLGLAAIGVTLKRAVMVDAICKKKYFELLVELVEDHLCTSGKFNAFDLYLTDTEHDKNLEKRFLTKEKYLIIPRIISSENLPLHDLEGKLHMMFGDSDLC